MILLGGLLLVRIVLSILQVLMDYRLLPGKHSVNFMEVSDLFSYPLLLLIIYIAVKYHTIQKIIGKKVMRTKMNKILKSFIVFVFLFLMNILIFTILATLGFQVTMSESSYLVPPVFAFIVLYTIHKRSGKGKKSV